VASIWIAAENRSLAATLAHHVAELGSVWLGEPERAAFKDASAPDLLILCGVAEPAATSASLERLLAFVRQVAVPRRAPAPVLYVAEGAAPGATAEVMRLFDDRRADALEFPFDPEELAARARALVASTARPASLRERARQSWVAGEVERLYATLDLPSLRQAVDPRNAHRPVLLLGEPGTRRGLLARYVHNLAEPPREALVTIALDEVPPGELERELAARAGLGAVGKNTLLLHPEAGSWFLLGELLLTVDLVPDAPFADLCGDCSRCLAACPTDALTAPYRLDANRCLSYWTIEHRGEVAEPIRPHLRDWVFGCDVCQEVCPWNAGAAPTAAPEFAVPSARRELSLDQLLDLGPEDFARRLRGSPLRRAKLEGLRRNAGLTLAAGAAGPRR